MKSAYTNADTVLLPVLIHSEFVVSPLATEEELTTTHSEEYVRKVMTG